MKNDVYKEQNKKWLKDTHKRLMESSTRYEWMVFKALPEWLRKRAKRQRTFQHEGHTYFFDIYLPCAKTAIEVDGGYHLMRKKEDAFRDHFVHSKGIKTFRISNQSVKDPNKLRAFVKYIESYCLTKIKKKRNGSGK